MALIYITDETAVFLIPLTFRIRVGARCEGLVREPLELPSIALQSSSVAFDATPLTCMYMYVRFSLTQRRTYLEIHSVDITSVNVTSVDIN